MTRYRLTEKMVAAEYADYRDCRKPWDAQNRKSGPATVYYLIADVKAAAKYYGWGDVEPLAMVDHMGDRVPVVEIVERSVDPVRVAYA